LKVLVLQTKDGGLLFYGENSEPRDGESETPSRRGLITWVEHQYLKLERVLNQSEGRLGLKLRRAWNWLHRFTGPDEAFLRSLRIQDRIELYYPQTLDPQFVLESWHRYISAKGRRHTVWLIVDTVISPVTLILTPIPGPNLLGYWIAYRAFCHLLAVLGVRGAEELIDSTTLNPEGLLDEFGAMCNQSAVSRLAEKFKLSGLSDFLNRATEKGIDPQATAYITNPGSRV
jgi:hypothetical protein